MNETFRKKWLTDRGIIYKLIQHYVHITVQKYIYLRGKRHINKLCVEGAAK